MRLIKRLLNPQQGHAAIMDAWQWAKPHLIAGAEMEITVKRATRNTRQNALLHAVLTDIAMQKEWAGSCATWSAGNACSRRHGCGHAGSRWKCCQP